MVSGWVVSVCGVCVGGEWVYVCGEWVVCVCVCVNAGMWCVGVVSGCGGW